MKMARRRPPGVPPQRRGGMLPSRLVKAEGTDKLAEALRMIRYSKLFCFFGNQQAWPDH
jgi:hypothetical protein